MPPLTRLSLPSIRFTPSSDGERKAGLLGWVSFEVGGLLLDGVALRRSCEGRPYLSFPSRRDRHGRDHPYIRPARRDVREAIERGVLAALELQEPAP